ncbi:MAG: competence/damage-inducible protein A [Balneolaceae bacterium]|nr:competence/damage-inducible protein A [Balneolaceae bacterium]
MTAEIISIGDELLLGDTVNTNASWLGRTLSGRGLQVRRVHTVGDRQELIRDCLEEALSRPGLVVATGGLGPTHDDVTKQAVAELFDCELRLHKPTLDFIRKVFDRRGIPFTRSNYHQAEVPEAAEVLFNTHGTAPGLWLERGEARLAVLPGVPHEMRHLVNEKVLPRLEQEGWAASQPHTCYLVTAGIGESTLSDEVLGDLSPWLGGELSLAFLPGVEGVCLRVTGGTGDPQEGAREMEPLLKRIRERAGEHLVGEGREESLARRVGELLRERELHIATAESCTGGRICDTLTDVPGSSDYVRGGIVAYDNEVKQQQLDVDPGVLREYGAVSRAVALQMAQGAATRLRADIGLSATGIAGPEGGTPDKPVGTVWVGYWSKERHFAFRACFTDDRQVNKDRTVAVALDAVRRTLTGASSLPYGMQSESA